MTRTPVFALPILFALSSPAFAQLEQVQGAHSLPLTVRTVATASEGILIPEPAANTLAVQAGTTTLNAFGPRRRGSMVGYIDDPIVSSKIRVRFETATHNRAPDRAELFYGKCGCYRDLNPDHPAYDPDASGPGPGAADDVNFQQFYALAEYAAGGRFSAFAELPVRWLQPQTVGVFEDHSGISDFRAGAKFGLATSDTMALTAQVKMFLNTGDSRQGLGTGHASIEPCVLYHSNLSDRAAIASQFSLWLPLGGSDGVPTSVDEKFAGSVLSYGIGPSYELFSSERLQFAPVVELVGWHVLGGFQTAAVSDASGTNIVNMKFGGRVNWTNGGSIYAGYGRALTDSAWYEDIFRFEYRLSF
jgi:hypothetical protein